MPFPSHMHGSHQKLHDISTQTIPVLSTTYPQNTYAIYIWFGRATERASYTICVNEKTYSAGAQRQSKALSSDGLRESPRLRENHPAEARSSAGLAGSCTSRPRTQRSGGCRVRGARGAPLQAVFTPKSTLKVPSSPPRRNHLCPWEKDVLGLVFFFFPPRASTRENTSKRYKSGHPSLPRVCRLPRPPSPAGQHRPGQPADPGQAMRGRATPGRAAGLRGVPSRASEGDGFDPRAPSLPGAPTPPPRGAGPAWPMPGWGWGLRRPPHSPRVPRGPAA